MFKKTRSPIIFLVLILMLFVQGIAFAKKNSGPTNLFSYLSQKEEDKKESKDFPDYKQYIDKSKELGFSPSTKLFNAIHDLLASQFYGTVTEKKLLDSTISEVGRLLDAAGISDTLKSQAFTTPEEYVASVIKAHGAKLNEDLIIYSAMCGLLKGTDDPYTIYMTPREYSQLMEQMQSAAFGGIGIYIELDPDNDKWLTVLETIDGTPAEKGGLKTGDVIEEIEGVSTRGIAIDVAVTKLRGIKGTPVTLTVKRKGVGGTLKITLIRDDIHVRSVSSKIIDSNIGYVKLRLFGRDTSQELEKAIQEMQGKGVKAMILDLRNNGGGYINAAVDVTSLFVDRGELIVSVRDKAGNTTKHISRGDYKSSLPLIVLVNKYSASASEITAGALKDYKRGILIGTKTFGKGSVQQVVPFPDGSALKVTISHYYTPNGSDIDKNGLEPDYKVEMEPRDAGKEKDPQLDKALEILRSNASR